MKFAEEYTYNCLSIKKFYKLPIVASKKSYLINDGRNSIVKVKDQKLLHSWTLEHPHYFTTPVVFSLEEESLFCVIDDAILLKWSLSDETLKEASKFQFQEAIFCILPLQKRKPLVVFASGRVLQTKLVYISPQPIGTQIVNKDEELIWADAFVLNSDTKVVCLGLNKEQMTYKLHFFSVKKKDVAEYSSQLIENGSHTLKNWCLDKYNFAFVAIWSNGAITSHLLHTQDQSPLLTIPNVEPSHLLAVSSVDADHIIVAIGDAIKKETTLEMWDTKFASVRAKKLLKTAPAEYHQLEVINSSIFWLSQGNLLEVSFDVEKSTLATALGKSLKVSSSSEYSWEESTLATTIGKSSNFKKGSKSQEVLNEDVVEQMDAEETNTIEILAQRFMEEGSAFKTNNRESDLLQLLRFALRAKRKKKAICDFNPDSLLNAIFSSTFRDAVLVQYVRKLNLEETEITLETLLHFLRGEISISVEDRPSDAQLFDWIFIIMKSHTEALLLSKDKKKVGLLKKLDQCISEKMDEYEDYVSIQNMFHMLQKKENILPTKHVVGKYFIESLDT